MSAIRKLIKIEPLDTLFFRDHRPFSAGEDTYAESGLPSPLTLYGGIGDYILKCQNKTIKDFYENKIDNNLGSYQEQLSDLNLAKIKIKGIFFSKGNEIYLPAPANLFGKGRKRSPITLSLTPDKIGNKKWDIPDALSIKPIILPDDKNFNPLEGLLEINDIKNFLSNNQKEISRIFVCPQNKIFAFEQRYGNYLSKETLTVENLYRTNHLRFSDRIDYRDHIKSGILVLVEEFLCNKIVSGQTMGIGGERRRVKITVGEDTITSIFTKDKKKILQNIKNTKNFFLYFITPAIFDNGWYSNKFLGKFNGAKLVGAAVNKPIYISGWVREAESKGKPRPIRKAVPAGSVYFFTANDRCDLDKIYNTYNINESLSDEYPIAGFGMTAIGVW